MVEHKLISRRLPHIGNHMCTRLLIYLHTYLADTILHWQITPNECRYLNHKQFFVQYYQSSMCKYSKDKMT
jgi:hypothetical protein